MDEIFLNLPLYEDTILRKSILKAIIERQAIMFFGTEIKNCSSALKLSSLAHEINIYIKIKVMVTKIKRVSVWVFVWVLVRANIVINFDLMEFEKPD